MSLLCHKVPRFIPIPFQLHRYGVVARPSVVPHCSTRNYSLERHPAPGTRSCIIPSQLRIVQGSKNDFAPLIQQQIRRKHGARKGLHLQNLDEIAHRTEHATAEERRQKKKEKTAARKGGKKSVAQSDDVEDEFDSFDVEKKKNKALPETGEDDWDEEEEEEEAHDETVLPKPSEVKDKMMKYVDSFRDYLKTIRGGQPSVEMFDEILVRDAYGRGTGDVPLKAVAQIVFSSPTLANATCFDPSTAKAVATAIRDELDLNPIEEEGTGAMKIPIPRISVELRWQLIHTIEKRAEQFRVRIRNQRRKALEVVKKGVAGKLEGVSKDDAFRVQQEIEAMTDVVIKELKKVLDKKEEDILHVYNV
jgi:ribosome recycling factor